MLVMGTHKPSSVKASGSGLRSPQNSDKHGPYGRAGTSSFSSGPDLKAWKVKPMKIWLKVQDSGAPKSSTNLAIAAAPGPALFRVDLNRKPF